LKTKIAVLDDYDSSVSKLKCWSALPSHFSVDFFSSAQDPAKLPTNLKDYEVLVTIRERTIITRDFLNQLPNLKHLAVTGRLSGQADLEELKKRGIAASYTDGSGQAPTELTIALLLGIAKRIHDRHNEVKSGGWQIGPAIGLSGKTLGVLGLGRIGAKVAQFGKLMGMDVVSWGPTDDKGRSQKLGVRRTTLDEVLLISDFLCVCLRLSDSTRTLLTRPKLSLMKNGASIINTSRAEIIEKQALYAELSSGRISAALDVFHQEPLPAEDPVRKFPNVLLSPHMGYVTGEVYETFFTQVVENITAWSSGKPYRDALEVGKLS